MFPIPLHYVLRFCSFVVMRFYGQPLFDRCLLVDLWLDGGAPHPSHHPDGGRWSSYGTEVGALRWLRCLVVQLFSCSPGSITVLSPPHCCWVCLQWLFPRPSQPEPQTLLILGGVPCGCLRSRTPRRSPIDYWW
jgi:hypothetical protein